MRYCSMKNVRVRKLLPDLSAVWAARAAGKERGQIQSPTAFPTIGIGYAHN